MGKPKFYDFCVHAVPDGDSTAQEQVSLGRHFGFSGIALANHSDRLPDRKPILPFIEGFEVFRGIELVEENPSKLHSLIGKFRNSMDVLIVHGGSEAVNRAALENPRVDILNHPAFDRSSGLNQVLAKAAAENGVAIGIILRPLLHSRGSRRIRLLSDLKSNLELARKYDVSLVLCSDAMSCFDLRSPMEMLALAEVCGLEEDEALEAISTVPEKIIAKNRPGPGYIKKGIEVLEGEDLF
ncbi:TPA: ribonuclease P protein component 3 [Methanosarcina acetivorans]|uniref:Ribonuclease P protein component 3 n=2 Tax=Methanosarcina acetivorans TaxID=2214 RepID=RNP3_METAC|nr:ribonuclease P protein component 3 [Methanosarcina acetivorans]Q8TPX2.1 RecName: Full=Ribonuclease P protein component 3; Short=RNase P component 3; AltName: Full=Rpp30 [Methanosarcina acetivorans C2A]AAM05188.1 ribonuclease P, subunit p30 [Methanosarcina acetivorans C2A]HIH93608.1 ribonuclease P protein component 3 [Methanosarcina acetivorans]